MATDIRDKAFISHADVIGLNFIRSSGNYVYRRHYRQGLRSHIMEVLKSDDVACERTGCEMNGMRWYPKAKPLKMLRIFRVRLASLQDALNEISRVKITERFLAPHFLATSSEFIVDYEKPGGGRELLLCGLQEYEDGEIIDPWRFIGRRAFVGALYDSLQGRLAEVGMTRMEWMTAVRHRAAEFVQRVKQMIDQAGFIPDLAGIGNLLVIPAGDIKLVDINNISQVRFESDIDLDDRGYPVCDKSIEALYLIEEKIIERSPDSREKIYQVYLDPQRRKRVKGFEELFYQKIKNGRGYPALQR